MTVAGNTVVPVFKRHAKGWPVNVDMKPGDRTTYLPLATALTQSHRFDAHFGVYSVPAVERRLATPSVFAEVDVPMVLFVIDVDGPDHMWTDEWWLVERPKVDRLLAAHPGGFVYCTKGGYRLVYRLAEPIVLRSTADAKAWKQRYLAWLDYVQVNCGIVGDPSCQDWTRTFRLPRVVRDGRSHEYLTIGDAHAIGTWDVEVEIPPPDPPRERRTTPTKPGEFDIRELLSREYADVRSTTTSEGERWDVECPWKHEHSIDSGPRQTSVFAYPSGAWEFICLHSHCSHRKHDEFRQWHDPSFVPYVERTNGARNTTTSNGESKATPKNGVAAERVHEMLAAAVLVDLTDYEPSKRTRQSGAAATTGKPEIIISPDRPGIVDAAERALASTGIVYVRSRQLVRVIRDHGARGWLERPKGSPVIVQIERDHLLDLLGRAATWIVIRDGTPKETSPPAWVAAMLMARGEWKLPQLEAIADAPVFRADGTIHEHPGYDERTRVIFDPCGVRFPSVPVSPSHADAKNALAELLDPFSEFPFVADSDRAATAAMVLSILGRAAIDGCVPMFASQAPAPGSGKGLLVDTVAMIATGRESPKMSPTEDDEETRKRLLAIALESPSMIMIDNVEGAIGGPSLAMALTAGEVRDRVLGSTKMVTATLRPVWAMTGNNIQLKGDLGRRVVPIDLDPKQEHPEDRTFNRGEPLTSYVARHRAALVVAALTVLRGFVVAGRPAHGHSAKGSFESWDRLVRAAIIWAGGADPLGGVTRIRTGADEDLDQLRALLVAWDGLIGCHAVTIADAIKRAGGSGALWDAFSAYCPNGKPPNARGLGYVLRAKQGRVAANLVLRRGSADRDGVMRWRVTAPTAAAEDVIERG